MRPTQIGLTRSRLETSCFTFSRFKAPQPQQYGEGWQKTPARVQKALVLHTFAGAGEVEDIVG